MTPDEIRVIAQAAKDEEGNDERMIDRRTFDRKVTPDVVLDLLDELAHVRKIVKFYDEQAADLNATWGRVNALELDAKTWPTQPGPKTLDIIRDLISVAASREAIIAYGIVWDAVGDVLQAPANDLTAGEYRRQVIQFLQEKDLRNDAPA
ncbi:hypothetical protein SEA_ZOOMAN_258 [Microbacterium phage Zooman]|nr:hypothetical protein SEA_ZOOMAN_258 [Microbacterium phage Zooman]